MASKLQRISDLADQTARSVTQGPDAWKRYLTTAARIYKYSFDDQLLIYAQRPDATACASMELWNNRMSRWIKPRSKSIALIHKDATGWPTLNYVFDVSDTRPVRGAKTPYLWELRQEHYAAVAGALAQRYGPGKETDFGGQLMEQASRAAGEVGRVHLEDLRYDTQGSFLERLNTPELEARFRRLLTASVQYTILTRCGLNPDKYLSNEPLEGIVEFSTPAVLHHLGSAVTAASKDLLIEIGRTIAAYEREAAKKAGKILKNLLQNRRKAFILWIAENLAV